LTQPEVPGRNYSTLLMPGGPGLAGRGHDRPANGPDAGLAGRTGCFPPICGIA
jgi:hypothetical protein